MNTNLIRATSMLFLGSVIMFVIPYYAPADMVQFHWGAALLLVIGVVLVILGVVEKEDA